MVEMVGVGMIGSLVRLIVKEEKGRFGFLIVVFGGWRIFLLLVDQV